MEIKITDAAREKIISLAMENKVEPVVRLYVLCTACHGAKFGIAFDDPRQYDVLTEMDGIEFITDTEYVPKYSSGLSVDYTNNPKEGFIITTLRPTKSSCEGGCSSCGKKVFA